jgi:uncharacterized membrane protein
MLLDQVKTTFLELMKNRRYILLLLTAILIYGTVFSYFTTMKHYRFSSYAWDLGTFDQALYTTWFHGRLFYYTPELLVNISGSFFAVHFSPILFLFLPFYAIHPSSVTLLVLKSFILALGALPLYMLAKEALKNEKASFIIALCYLLYPAVQASNWFDFQPQALLPLLIFSSAYFLLKKRWKLYFAATFLALMVEEHISLIILVIALYNLYKSGLRRLPQSIKQLKMDKQLALTLTIAVSVIWFITARTAMSRFPLEAEFLEEYRALNNFEVLGIEGDPLSLPLHVLQHPDLAFQALLYDYPVKFLYIILLFGPLLFIPLRSRLSIIIFALVTPFLLSNFRAYYTIGCHYPLYVLPLVFLAGVEALSKRAHVTDWMPALKNMVVVTLIFIVSTSPISPVAETFASQGFFWYPSLLPLDERVDSMHAMLHMVPHNASVLTQNHVFPHVSNRLNAYVIPIARWTSPMSPLVKDYLKQLVDKSDYVFLDLRHRGSATLFVLSELTNGTRHAVYAFSGKAVLFKKGSTSTPIFVPGIDHEVFRAERDLDTVGGRTVRDASSQSGVVRLFPKGSNESLLYGPYVFLPPGEFEVTFVFKAEEPKDGYLGTFDVAGDHGNVVLARKDLYGFELEPNEWKNVTLSFSSTEDRIDIETRFFADGTTNTYIDTVIIKRTSNEALVNFGSLTFNFKKLLLASGYKSDEGFLIHPKNLTSNFFWYGPYAAVPEGRYEATFFLKTVPKPQDPDEKIITLDIASDKGNTTIAPNYEVYASSLMDFGRDSDWRMVTLGFSLEKEGCVEIRGFTPSEKYTIYLGFILLERLVK